MQDTNTLPAADAEAVPDLDVLLNRASLAARGLLDARDAHAGGTANLVTAYEELFETHQAAVAALAAREDELARCEGQLATRDVEVAQLDIRLEAALSEGGRLGDEVRRLSEVAREALGQVRSAHAERDDIRTRHDSLVAEHRRLTLAFQELITQVGQGARNLSDEGRRISGLVGPLPSRPRPAPLRAEAESLPAPEPRRAVAAPPRPVAFPAPAPVAQVVPMPSAPPAPVRAPVQAPEPTGDIHADIASVLALSVPGRSVAPTSPQPAANRADDVVEHIEEPERRDMAQTLKGFGSLLRRA